MNTYYFNHNVNTYCDRSILQLRYKYGWAGYGIYWALLEYLATSPEYKISIDEIEFIAMHFGVDYEMLKDIILNFGLFTINDNMFYSELLLNNLTKRKEKIEKLRENAKKKWQKSDAIAEQLQSNCNAIAEQLQLKEKDKEKEKEKEKDKDKDKDKEKDIIYTEEEIKLINYFISTLPKHIRITETLKKSWVITYRQLINIDKRDKNEIMKVIQWARNNDFWSRNFLSITKLRKKNKDGVMYYDIFLNQCNSYNKISQQNYNNLVNKIGEVIINKKI